MKYLPFKFKIIVIFLLPSMVLVYLLSVFIIDKYTELQESATIKLSTEITTTLSDLVHNIQIERGLSSGYIQTNHQDRAKQRLLKQYMKTDKVYKKFQYYLDLKSETKTRFQKKVSKKVFLLEDQIIDSLKKLQKMRKKILNFELDFDDKIKYYSDIDRNLILLIKIINNIIYNQNNSSMIEILQYQKEAAGLERAYIYSQLMSDTINQAIKLKIDKLQETQKVYEAEFLVISPSIAMKYYNQNINQEIKFNLNKYRKCFRENNLSVKNAYEWFLVSTEYIEKLDDVLMKIFKQYTSDSNYKHDSAEFNLFLALGLGFSSYLALLLMFFLLKKLIKKEEHLMQDLKFAAYAFESHEAMVITDTDGTILKVNKSFTDITGYTSDEAVGGNPRILKSGVHKDDFFKNMYEQLHSVGKWSAEIYNKRKNGEIYPELLSITAIKNIEGVTTNYIAQFLDISELKDAQEKAIYQANHDFLTGIMNRKALTQRLEEEFFRATRHKFLEAFLFIDLDNFKSVNDTYGHKVGDLMLIEFASRLRSILRKEDVLARISGDEFAIIISNSDNSKDALVLMTKEVCDKIFHVISQEFLLDGHSLNIGASIGVSIFPDEQNTSDYIVSQADEAMYKAKSAGKNTMKFYE